MGKLRYTTWGSVRGGCDHIHRTMRTAFLCIQRDQRGCEFQGGATDRHIRALEPGHEKDLYDVTRGPGRTLNEAEYAELVRILDNDYYD